MNLKSLRSMCVYLGNALTRWIFHPLKWYSYGYASISPQKQKLAGTERPLNRIKMVKGKRDRSSSHLQRRNLFARWSRPLFFTKSKLQIVHFLCFCYSLFAICNFRCLLWYEYEKQVWEQYRGISITFRALCCQTRYIHRYLEEMGVWTRHVKVRFEMGV